MIQEKTAPPSPNHSGYIMQHGDAFSGSPVLVPDPSIMVRWAILLIIGLRLFPKLRFFKESRCVELLLRPTLPSVCSCTISWCLLEHR